MHRFNPRQYCSGNSLVGTADGEYFRHMTVALRQEHGRTVSDAIFRLRSFQLAKLIMDALGICRHLIVSDSGIELCINNHDRYPRAAKSILSRESRLSRLSSWSATASASASTSTGTASPAAGRGRKGSDPFLTIPFDSRIPYSRGVLSLI